MKKNLFLLIFSLVFLCSFQNFSFAQGTTTVVSDSTWKITTNTALLTAGWNSNPTFNTTNWSKPGAGKTDCTNTAITPLTGSQLIWAPTVANNQMVFMRKVFFVPSNNLSSYSISINADDNAQVYLNGAFIGATTTKGVTKIFNTTTIKSALKCGNNVISVIARNVDACAWVSLSANWNWNTPVAVNLPKEGCVGKVISAYVNSGACQSCIGNVSWTVSPSSIPMNPIAGHAFNHTFTAAGTYTVTLNYTNTCEKKEYKQEFSIVVKNCCSVDYVVSSLPEKVCLKDSIKLSAMATKCLDCIKDPKWLKGTTVVATGNMVKIQATTVGSQVYTFTYFNTCENRQVTINKNVNVIDCCQPTISVPEKICMGEKALFFFRRPASCGDCISELSWTLSTPTTAGSSTSIASTIIGTKDSVNYSFTAAGYNQVCLKYYNKCTQKTETLCKYIYVVDCCTPKITGPKEVCKGKEAQFSIAFPTDACAKCVGKVYWKFTDSSKIDTTGLSDTHVFNTPGTYQVCARIENTCNPNIQSLPICMTVVVKACDSTAVNACNIKLEWSHTQVQTTGSIAQFTANATNTAGFPIVAYHWSFGDGTWSAEANPKHDYKNYSPTYKVCLTVYADTGNGPCECKVTVCREIQMGLILDGGENPNPPAPPVAPTMSRSDNMKGANLMKKLPQLESYPNPFNDNFTLDLNLYKAEELQGATLELYDSLGRLVRKMDGLSPQELTINGAKLSEGIYHININKDGRTILTTKIVKSGL